MAVKWELHTSLPDVGRVSIVARIVGERVIFDHPSDGSVVLEVTEERAERLSKNRYEQRKLNLHLERTVVHVPRDVVFETLETMKCPHCGKSMTWIDHDFVLHSFPWCKEWRIK